jgi:hypothetical protein
MVTFAEDYFIQEGIQHPWIDLEELGTIMPDLETIRIFWRNSREHYMWSYGPVMPSLLIRRTVYRESDIDAELIEDLAIHSSPQDDCVESHGFELITDDEEKTNPLRQFWTHEEILEMDAFFRHSDGDEEGRKGMLA